MVKVFVYGTLKRGFGNFWLTSEMTEKGHAKYLGVGRTKERYPLVCGPYMVPFLINKGGHGEHVWGEIYELDDIGLGRFDELEGTTKSHYTRLPIVCIFPDLDSLGNTMDSQVSCQAYFAHENYASRLWLKAGHKCLPQYSLNESKNYVKRNNRAPNLSFLDHIERFICGSSFCDDLPPQPAMHHRSGGIAVGADL